MCHAWNYFRANIAQHIRLPAKRLTTIRICLLGTSAFACAAICDCKEFRAKSPSFFGQRKRDYAFPTVATCSRTNYLYVYVPPTIICCRAVSVTRNTTACHERFSLHTGRMNIPRNSASERPGTTWRVPLCVTMFVFQCFCVSVFVRARRVEHDYFFRCSTTFRNYYSARMYSTGLRHKRAPWLSALFEYMYAIYASVCHKLATRWWGRCCTQSPSASMGLHIFSIPAQCGAQCGLLCAWPCSVRRSAYKHSFVGALECAQWALDGFFAAYLLPVL